MGPEICYEAKGTPARGGSWSQGTPKKCVLKFPWGIGTLGIFHHWYATLQFFLLWAANQALLWSQTTNFFEPPYFAKHCLSTETIFVPTMPTPTSCLGGGANPICIANIHTLPYMALSKKNCYQASTMPSYPKRMSQSASRLWPIYPQFCLEVRPHQRIVGYPARCLGPHLILVCFDPKKLRGPSPLCYWAVEQSQATKSWAYAIEE